jgi:sodium pump decarboxylase gamma subunit
MDLLMQGIVLMVIGMATVFAFLVLLILAMNGSATFFKKFAHLFPEEEKTQPKRCPQQTPPRPLRSHWRPSEPSVVKF